MQKRRACINLHHGFLVLGHTYIPKSPFDYIYPDIPSTYGYIMGFGCAKLLRYMFPLK